VSESKHKTMTMTKLKIYGLLAGIFLLGAGAGAGVAYAASERRLAELVGEERGDGHETRRFFALARELELTDAQRAGVRDVLSRHRDESRKLNKTMLDTCGQGLREQKAKVDAEIRLLLTETQRRRFDELSAKRGARFPFGGGPGRRPHD
jgi:Spy/CpxP family protein refolding chaperone